MQRYFLFLCAVTTLFSGVIKQPETAITEQYPHAKFDKKRALLTGAEAAEIEHEARQKLPSKIITYYVIEKGKKKIYAVLQTMTVRSKTMTALTFIEAGKIVAIEMIAFYEPGEYLPIPCWLETLNGKGTDDAIQPKRDLPTITGATLSANAVAKTARLALAFVNIKLERP